METFLRSFSAIKRLIHIFKAKAAKNSGLCRNMDSSKNVMGITFPKILYIIYLLLLGFLSLSIISINLFFLSYPKLKKINFSLALKSISFFIASIFFPLSTISSLLIRGFLSILYKIASPTLE